LAIEARVSLANPVWISPWLKIDEVRTRVVTSAYVTYYGYVVYIMDPLWPRMQRSAR
jgi:hypothetical protein